MRSATASSSGCALPEDLGSGALRHRRGQHPRPAPDRPRALLAARTAPAGRIALSGILDSQADEVARRLRAVVRDDGRVAARKAGRCSRAAKNEPGHALPGLRHRVSRAARAARARAAARCAAASAAQVFDGVAALVEEGAEPLTIEPSPQLGLFDSSRRAVDACEEDAPLPAFLAEEEAAAPLDCGGLDRCSACWRRRRWQRRSCIATAARSWRSSRAAREPLAAACRLAGCQVLLPRRAAEINIESSDLQADGRRAGRAGAAMRCCRIALPCRRSIRRSSSR